MLYSKENFKIKKFNYTYYAKGTRPCHVLTYEKPEPDRITKGVKEVTTRTRTVISGDISLKNFKGLQNFSRNLTLKTVLD